jgi:uncharacterized membrane protein
MVLGCIAILVCELVWFVRNSVMHRPFDLNVYLWGGRELFRGTGLYMTTVTAHWFTYPPVGALVFVPLSRLPVDLARAAWTLSSLLALLVICILSLHLAKVRARMSLVLPVLVAASLLQPVQLTLHYGQINLILLALILVDMRLQDIGRRSGVGIGVAAAIKLTPAIFIVALLAARRVRAAATATVTFAVCTGVGFIAAPSATRLYWTRIFFDTRRVGSPYISNQSPYGALVRLLHGTGNVGAWYLAIPVTLGLVGIAVSATYMRQDMWLEATVTAGTTSLLVSPISWTHHWVWVIPALALAGKRPRLRSWLLAASTYFLFLLAPMWWTPWHGGPGEYGFHGLQSFVANCYLAAGLAFLICMARASYESAKGRPSGTPGVMPQVDSVVASSP